MKKNNSSKHLWLTAAFSLFAIFSFAQNQCPSDPLTILREGNRRFCSDQTEIKHQDMARVNELKTGQNPFAIVVSCSDSRVAPEIVFDQGLGDIFIIRTAGNVMSDIEEGSIEYAAAHLGSKLIVVLGHTKCGAVKAFVDLKHNDAHENHDAHGEHGEHAEQLGHIQAIIDKMDSADEIKGALETEGDTYDLTTRANVTHGVKQLRDSDPILSEKYKKGDIQIVGAIYHVENGEVEFLDI